MMRKDHRGPKTPVAERDRRTRPRALTRETREAAAWWARHRSNEGFLLPRQRVANSLRLDFALTPHTRCFFASRVVSLHVFRIILLSRSSCEKFLLSRSDRQSCQVSFVSLYALFIDHVCASTRRKSSVL